MAFSIMFSLLVFAMGSEGGTTFAAMSAAVGSIFLARAREWTAPKSVVFTSDIRRRPRICCSKR